MKSLYEYRISLRGKDGLRTDCIDCERLCGKVYRQNNKEKIKERNRRMYLQCQNDRIAGSAQYRKDNQEKVKKAWVSWSSSRRHELSAKQCERAKREPEKNREKRSLRRAREARAIPKWANRFFMSEAYRLALLREKVCGGKWHVDHIVPLRSPIVCGLHWEKNFAVIPGRANQVKGNRQWPDMPTQ